MGAVILTCWHFMFFEAELASKNMKCSCPRKEHSLPNAKKFSNMADKVS